MTPAERIQLARQRREIQLAANMERERMMPPPRMRSQRLRFSPEVALLEATSRADIVEVEKLLMEGADPSKQSSLNKLIIFLFRLSQWRWIDAVASGLWNSLSQLNIYRCSVCNRRQARDSPTLTQLWRGRECKRYRVVDTSSRGSLLWLHDHCSIAH
jgi:hypothetical protein